MALAVTLKASGELGLNTGGEAVSQAIAAIDFAAGSLVMVALGSTTDDPAPGAPYLTCSASGLSFTAQADGFVASTFRAVARVLTALHGSGGSTTLTLSTGGQATFGIFYSVYEVTGHAETPIGATAGNADETQDGQRTLTLDATPDSTSIVIAGITADTNSGTNVVTPGTGWTEDAEVDSSGSNFGFWQTQRRSGSTSTNVVWDDVRPDGSQVVFSTGAVAVEVVEGAAAATDLDGTDTVQAQTATAAALTQTHELAAASAVQAQSATAAALTQVHELQPTSAVQGQTATAPALTQVHELSATDTVQAQTADTVALFGDALINLDFIALAPVFAHGAAMSPELRQRVALAPEFRSRVALAPVFAHGDPSEPTT